MRADEVHLSIPRMVLDNAESFGELVAVVDDETRISYAELSSLVLQSCRAALALGVEPGDRVAVWAPNIHEWIIAALGLLGAGAILVPVNTRYKGEEAAFVIRRSGARALFTVEGFLGLDFVALLRAADPSCEALKRCVVLRGDAPAEAVDWHTYLDRGHDVSEAAAHRVIDSIGADAVSDIIFTSGTTGTPKGVMLTHRQSLRAFEAFNVGFGLQRGDQYLVIPPFFHCFGYKAGWMLCFMVGATCYPQSVFDPPSVLDRIEQERITVFAGAPTMIAGVLDLVATTTRDISSLRYSFVGAASVPEELVRRMYRELTLEAVGVGYGLTEATAIVSNTHYDDEPDVVASSCGRAIEGIDVAIFDGEGIELPIGEVGEVVVRGFNVMRGYYDDPEATQAVIDEQGWLHTGDVGVLDHRGNLHITDRIKDMYIVGGFNAYPAEIESILLRDDRLAQVAVIGVPDERLGEVGAAFVVPRPGACVKPDDVVQFARERMANFKAPRYVEVVDALPVNATGKVLKGDLRHRFTHER